MNLLEDLPKEIRYEEFGEFLEMIEREFPANEFPELFVHYQKNNHKIVVLAVGSSNECAEQVVKVFKKHPNLRAQSGMSRMIRAPKTKFLLRRTI
jgi:hypothetical protein